jgi:hypothetical protein
VWLDQRADLEGLPRGAAAYLDAAEVLGADEAVLPRAHQANRRAVVGVERALVEPTTWLVVTGWNATAGERNLLGR